MKTSIITFILFISLFSISCHPDRFPGKDLHIGNNSSERIYYWYSGEYNAFHYPDTILPVEKPVFISSCAAGNLDKASGYDPNYDHIFSQLPEGKLSVYFFDELATTQEEWDDIRVNHMVLRKDVTLEELKINDYIIFYP